MEKKQASNKVLWIFAIGQLGWSILSGIVTNWLVFFYQPTSEELGLGQVQFVQPKPIFLGLTVIGLVAAVLCLGGAVIFLAYHESKIKKIIQK